jgi:hypothetical protein
VNGLKLPGGRADQVDVDTISVARDPASCTLDDAEYRLTTTTPR